MEFPKISIVIPSYNKAAYLGETLKSIFLQDYKNIEVIIQDGGSADESLEIIKKFANKYPKNLSWYSERDKGQADAINKGFKKAKGEVFCFLNADDVYKKHTLSKVARVFSDNKVLWFAGRGDVIDSGGKKIALLVTIYKNILLSINSYSLLLIVNYFTQPSVFFRKELYKRYGPFGGLRKGVIEYDFWLKMGKKKMPKVTRELLSSFRITPDTISSVSYPKILKMDYKIAKNYTNNSFILFLHKLHNWGRVLVVRLMHS